LPRGVRAGDPVARRRPVDRPGARGSEPRGPWGVRHARCRGLFERHASSRRNGSHAFRRDFIRHDGSPPAGDVRPAITRCWVDHMAGKFDPDYRGKHLQLQFTVDDESVEQGLPRSIHDAGSYRPARAPCHDRHSGAQSASPSRPRWHRRCEDGLNLVPLLPRLSWSASVVA
jgi:hypothetical protein